MKKYKEIVVNIKQKTDEFKALEKLVKSHKMTKKQMEDKLQRNYRAKGVSYEKYN